MDKIKDESSKRITVAGHDIYVKRVKMKNLHEVTRAFKPFVKEFDRIVSANNSMPPNELMGLIGDYSEGAIILAVVLTDKDASFYRELSPAEFFAVAQEVVALSGDFFMREIFTPLKKLGAQIHILGTIAYSPFIESDSESET